MIEMPGDQDDLDPRVIRHDLLEQLDPIHPGHHQVGDDEIAWEPDLL